jgi:hypothetical protein
MHKESLIDKIKGFTVSIANTITQMRGGNQTEGEEDTAAKKKSKNGADAQPRDDPPSPERARLLAVKRLIEEQKMARKMRSGGGRRGNDDEEGVLAVLVPNSQPNVLQGFVGLMLSHPLIFLMCFDIIVGIATSKTVPAEVALAEIAFG